MPPSKTRFLQPDAYEALLVRHRHEAINGFIRGDLSNIDPNFGTTQCQSFTVFAVNKHHELTAALKKEGRLEKARTLATEYKKTIGSKKTITQIRTVSHVWGTGKPSDDYLKMFEWIENLMGKEHVELAGLCVTLTAACSLSADEVDIVFSRRPLQPYLVSTAEAEASNDKNKGLNKEADLRAMASEYIHDYMIGLAKGLTSADYEPQDPGAPPKAYSKLLNQLAAATEHMTATVPNPGKRGMPVIATFNSIPLIFADQWQRGHLIGERARRSITKHDAATGEGDESEEEDSVDEEGIIAKPRSLHRFNDTIVMLWKPNKATGQFERVEVTDENRNTPCVIFDTSSVASSDAPGDGLLSPDRDVFMQAVDEAGLEPRILIAVAGKNQFRHDATGGPANSHTVYEAFCDAQASHKVGLDGITGLSFAPQKDGDQRISLSNLYNGCCLAAQSAGLINYKAINPGSSLSAVYIRNDQPVGSACEHVYPATAAQLQSRCDDIEHRHEKAGYPFYGSLVIRVGLAARSFTSAINAARINNKRNSNTKAKEHDGLHHELKNLYI